MRQIILTILAVLVFLCNVEAQTIRELDIYQQHDAAPSVYLASCSSPSHGVLVFRTSIINLNIEMSPPSALIRVSHDRQRNEYVLCVRPTDGRYRLTFTHSDFVGIDFTVEDIIASQAQIFTINPKDDAAQVRIRELEAQLERERIARENAERERERAEQQSQQAPPTQVPNIEMVFVQGNKSIRNSIRSFNIGKYEVTQAQWQAVMGNNPSNFKGDNLPVEMVSWNDVQEFIRKLNALTGRNYRLPTEAEWEYAARGGDSSRGYEYSGSNNINDVAWYRDNSDRRTHPVGTKAPNELGIYDMSGNVWEWCQDAEGSRRWYRGGSWPRTAGFCRVADRFWNGPGVRDYDIGFRLVLP